MSLISKIKQVFAEAETQEEETSIEFVDVKTEDGRIMRVSDLSVGSSVMEITEDGEVAVDDGTYVLEDGNAVVVEGGVIAEIIEPEAEEEASSDEEEQNNMASARTIEGIEVYYDGELAVGTALFLNEEMTEPATDGPHTLEDGTAIVVDGGMITEMTVPTSEDMEKEDNKEDKEDNKEVDLFMDVTLKDGPIAHIVTAKEGNISKGDRMMIDEVEAGPGDYETANGQTVTVGEAGVIDSIVSADEKVESEEEEVVGVVKNLKNLITQIKDLKSQFEEMNESFEAIKKENEELKEEVQKFSKAPSDKPTKTKVDFKKEDKSAKLEFFARRK